jgi:predicted alpha/beta hydrolase family esterase
MNYSDKKCQTSPAKNTIIIIPGLGASLDDWKISHTCKKTIYDHIITGYNVIDGSLKMDSYQEEIENLLEVINKKIPHNTYIVTSSFGSVIALLYLSRSMNRQKIKGVLMVDPTTTKDLHRLKQIKNIHIRENLMMMVEQQQCIDPLSLKGIPVIIHASLSLKYICGQKPEYICKFIKSLNVHMKHLSSLTTCVTSKLITYTNGHHNIHQSEPCKIAYSIDELCSI